MSARSRSIEKPVAVVVEGLDYFHLILSQIQGRTEFESVELWDFCPVGSLRHWLEDFRTLRNFHTLRALGVIRDAETDAAAMIASVRARLTSNGFPTPENNGDIHQGPPVAGS